MPSFRVGDFVRYNGYTISEIKDKTGLIVNSNAHDNMVFVFFPEINRYLLRKDSLILETDSDRIIKIYNQILTLDI